MEYRIVLSRLIDGRYVHVMSCQTYGIVAAKSAYHLLKERFYEPEFKIEVEEWQKVGKVINLDRN